MLPYINSSNINNNTSFSASNNNNNSYDAINNKRHNESFSGSSGSMGSSGSPYDNPTYLPNLLIPTNLPTCPTYLSYMALWLIQYSSDASIK